MQIESARAAQNDPSGLTSVERTALLPRYEILEEVGRGGMGVVYRGRHCELDIPVAVKVCLVGAITERFHQEAKLLAKLHSPYVVTVRDFERLDGNRTLLVMDWVAGQDLARILNAAQGPLPESRVFPWMQQVCEGMRAAAEQRIVHRDLKPANILVDERDQIRISDFGLARSVYDIQLTHTGVFMGTPHYMAPEQAEDPRTVDERSDIYSFGATFYHVLTGRPPFEGETLFAILFRHKMEPLISPQARNPSLSTRISECLERCLAKSPHERFPTFEAVLASINPSPTGMSPWDAGEDRNLFPYLERYRARREIYLTRPFDLLRPDVYEFPPSRRIVVQYGSLVDQCVDAVVSSDDYMLTMGGGVSLSLARAAGPNLAQEAQRFVPVRPGRAVVTTAGALPARFVFHAVTMGREWEKATRVRPSRDLITELMHSCFYHADTLHIKTLAFPLLGTGAGLLSRDVCLDTMFRFLARRFLQGMTSVSEARIVLFPAHYDSASC